MRRLLPLALLIASTSLSMGCAACCSPYDYAFGYYGGAWQRDDLCNGRVGSIIAPAGSPVVASKQKGPAADPESSRLPELESDLKSQPESEPKPADLDTSSPLKSVKRTRPSGPSRSYPPLND